MKEQIKKALNKFVSTDEFREPMMGIHNNEEYLVATHGHVIAEISLDRYPDLKDIGSFREGYPSWKAIFEEPELKEEKEISIPVLKTPSEKFIPVEDKNCGNCSARGWTKAHCNSRYCEGHEVECCDCHGTGVMKDFKIQIIKIDDRFYDASYINDVVDLFDCLKIESGNVGFIGNKLVVSGAGVRCLVANILRDEDIRAQVLINEISLKGGEDATL